MMSKFFDKAAIVSARSDHKFTAPMSSWKL
uniref:Uncharacterized protein n=1 Tax=Arundo donax TaxID=35708 RepID=A0A0A9ARF4_ARUDO